MRFIVLSEERAGMLTRIYKKSRYHRVRQRAHCILLSGDGYTTSRLKKIFRTDLTTIYNRFDAWESESLVGLYDKKGKGGKPELTAGMKEKVMELIKEYPENIGSLVFCGVVICHISP